VLQARQHRVQTERAGARGAAVAESPRAESEARAGPGQSGHLERVVVTTQPDEHALKALTEKISQARGLRCEAYKERCLRRRLAVRMRARGVHTFDAYSQVLDEDSAEYDRLIDTLT